MVYYTCFEGVDGANAWQVNTLAGDGLACLKQRDSSMASLYLCLFCSGAVLHLIFFALEGKMTLFELFLIGIGLSMDAFAVAVCKGLSMRRIDKKCTLLIGLFFGGFQALMPLIGYILGNSFAACIESFDHWAAFILLALIGGNMVKESREREEEEKPFAGIHYKELLLLAIATSIDALAVGITFAFLEVEILPAIALIGCTTFVLSIGGVYVGNLFGIRYKSRAELAGGTILILIGLKILLEHLDVL